MESGKLIEFCPHLAPFIDGLNASCARFEIADGDRLRMFLAQMAAESNGFTKLVENLNYTHADVLYRTFPKRFTSAADAALFCGDPRALANRVYANRNGNGDEASGDGWTFRGRGWTHLTFRGNYVEAGLYLHNDRNFYVRQPDLAADIHEAPLIAGWYWQTHDCNRLADAGRFDEITQRINGGQNGADRRHEWLATAEKYL